MTDSEITWSVKEVIADLKKDILDRLSKQDVALVTIERRIDNTATKEDIRELHARIDGVSDRTKALEDARDAANAQGEVKSRFRSRIWMGTAAVLVPIGTALIIVFVH